MADPIVISDSDDDEQVKQAIALSLADDRSFNSNPPDPSPANGLSALFPDRKAMEEARLARIRKRTRPTSPADTVSRKSPRLEQTSVDLPSGARLNMIVQADQATRKDPVAQAASTRMGAKRQSVQIDTQPRVPGADIPGDVVYPYGVVKKTWAFGHDRTGDEIKLEEVLEPATLRTAILSAYQWDTTWILDKLRIPPRGGSTKCVFIMQGKEKELREEMLQQTEDLRAYLRLCFPPMEGQTHCMHSKLQLLFHPKKLRIAIPTANLLNFDWGETGMMENSVWLIDLPRLAPGVSQDVNELPSFGEDLIYFLRAQTLDKDVIKGLLNFDFTATEHIAFVHSVGGISEGINAEKTGLPGLARAVRGLGIPTNDLQVDFAASSIGSLNDTFLGNVYDACRGEDMLAKLGQPAAPPRADFFKPASSKKSEQPRPKPVRERFHIYFPTYDTVRASTAGAAGTICLSRKWFEDMPFPRSIFRDYVSTRRGLLSHNKNLFARGKQQLSPTGRIKDVAWAYVGSANMSESAWGKMTRDRKSKEFRVNCRNWECGVVLPVLPRKQGDAARLDRSDTDVESDDVPAQPGLALSNPGSMVGMDVFDGVVKPPFEYPGSEYGNREPWYFKEFQEPKSRQGSNGESPDA